MFFACNLPWEWLSVDLMACLVEGVLLTVATARYLNARDYMMPECPECISVGRDIPARFIERFADVEALIGREDLTPADVHWTPFKLIPGDSEASPLDALARR